MSKPHKTIIEKMAVAEKLSRLHDKHKKSINKTTEKTK